LQDLREGLQAFITGETVDYKWENEDGTKEQLESNKRTSLKSLPDHLVIHLKRFEYDFDSQQQVKLNDRFEFPRLLDTYEFTVDGRPDQVDPALKRPKKAKKAEGGTPGVDGGGLGGDADAADDEPAAPAAEDAGPARPREYYQYELSGCVIHTGTAQFGHYYSFAKDRVGGRWMLLNDSSVRDALLLMLPSLCTVYMQFVVS
jgi:ubiquitin C-terminal hydrolase